MHHCYFIRSTNGSSTDFLLGHTHTHTFVLIYSDESHNFSFSSFLFWFSFFSCMFTIWWSESYITVIHMYSTSNSINVKSGLCEDVVFFFVECFFHILFAFFFRLHKNTEANIILDCMYYRTLHSSTVYYAFAWYLVTCAIFINRILPWNWRKPSK